MTIKAFIFDLDGVIVLSEPLGLRAWRKWLAPYGKTLSFQIMTDKMKEI